MSMNWQYADPVHISSIFVYFEAKQSLIHASISWRERLSVVTDVEYTLTADCIFWISFGCCGDVWMSIKLFLIVHWKRKNIIRVIQSIYIFIEWLKTMQYNRKLYCTLQSCFDSKQYLHILSTTLTQLFPMGLFNLPYGDWHSF